MSPSKETVYSRLLEKLPIRHSPEVVKQDKRQSDAISRGIEKIRLASSFSGNSVTESHERTDSSSSESDEMEEHNRAINKAAEDLIINSEKFKASATVLPEGKKTYDYNNDGDFMMSTCHVETGVIEKAHKGHFVELDKLRNKSLKELMAKDGDQYRFNVMTKEGQSYLVAANSDKDNKITNYRRWEQAFKVYMILYTERNPERAPEILAYADIISNASQNYVWENVAMYDFYFRKLMEKHPERSWARTHTQLWSLTMKEHQSFRSGANGNGKGQGKSGKSLREICCFRYNKGKCTRGDGCRFEHRCSQCGSYDHIYLACPCRGRKNKDNKGADKKDSDNASAPPPNN